MKIRKGFVSNSSSSSFICDVCGENVSGMDMELSDAKMFECTVGHVICDNHKVSTVVGFYDLDGLEAKKAYCLARVEYDFTKELIANAENEDELEDLYSYEIEDELRYNTPSEYCPCCTLDTPSDDQVLEFLFAEVKSNKEKVGQAMKERFGNYKKMCDELKL